MLLSGACGERRREGKGMPASRCRGRIRGGELADRPRQSQVRLRRPSLLRRPARARSQRRDIRSRADHDRIRLACHACALRFDAPLEQHGLEWIEPPAMVAHPFDDGTAAVIERSVERPRRPSDAIAARTSVCSDARPPMAADRDVGPGPLGWPQHPLALAAFGMRALRCGGVARGAFARTAGARAVCRESRHMGCCRSIAGRQQAWPRARRDGARGRVGAAARTARSG